MLITFRFFLFDKVFSDRSAPSFQERSASPVHSWPHLQDFLQHALGPCNPLHRARPPASSQSVICAVRRSPFTEWFLIEKKKKKVPIKAVWVWQVFTNGSLVLQCMNRSLSGSLQAGERRSKIFATSAGGPAGQSPPARPVQTSITGLWCCHKALWDENMYMYADGFIFGFHRSQGRLSSPVRLSTLEGEKLWASSFRCWNLRGKKVFAIRSIQLFLSITGSDDVASEESEPPPSAVSALDLSKLLYMHLVS